MSTTLTLPDVTAPIQALTAWLAQPTTKKRVQTAVSEAVAETEQYVLNSTSLRVPRQHAERQNGFRSWLDAFATHGFEHWLNSYRHRIAQDIQREMLLEFPEVFAGLRNRELIRETVETLLWPEIEPLLRNRAEELLLTYAVRGIALAWTSRNLGDNLLVGIPERNNMGWRVPLHFRGTEVRVAQVDLDLNGEVLSEIGAMQAAVGITV
jgi:hypothetical protein